MSTVSGEASEDRENARVCISIFGEKLLSVRAGFDNSTERRM